MGSVCIPFWLGLEGIPLKPQVGMPVPMLMRRWREARLGMSSSSTALSSKVSPLLERLPRRRKLHVGLVPDNPTPVDIRRRCSPAAAVDTVCGKADVPPAPDIELLCWKRVLRVACETEPRRCDISAGAIGGLFPPLEDIFSSGSKN